MGNLKKIFARAKNPQPEDSDENIDKKNGIFTSGGIQGEDIGSSDVNSDSGFITRGSVLNYRDKQKRQGLFGNIGTILGN